MADVSLVVAGMDISKLKVPDLKKELKNRGLNTSGNKNDLVERLQTALKSNERTSNESVDDLDEDLLNEDDDDVHLESTESVISDIDTALSDPISLKTQKRKSNEPEEKSAPITKKVVLNRNTPVICDTSIITEKHSDTSDEAKKVVKLTGLTAKERLELRAKKFDVSLGPDAKKVARAERFGAQNGSQTKTNTSVDVLKKRAERFGSSVSTVMSKIDNQERLEKRKQRFGIVTDQDKAQKRLERFKQAIK